MIYTTLHRKLNFEQRFPLKPTVNSAAPDGQTVPTSQITLNTSSFGGQTGLYLVEIHI